MVLPVNAGKDAKKNTTFISGQNGKREAESEYTKFRLEVEVDEYITPEKNEFRSIY